MMCMYDTKFYAHNKRVTKTQNLVFRVFATKHLGGDDYGI